MNPTFDIEPVPISDTDILNKISDPKHKPGLFKLSNDTLSRLSALIPTIATLPATQLFAVTIPAGQDLIKVAGEQHVYRGLFHSTADGARGISGHVKMRGLSPAATVGSVIAVTSFAVGQHYMTEINDQLKGINRKLDSIAEFQKIGFASKVTSLLTRVQQLQTTANDYIDDDSRRQVLLISLNDEAKTASELLDQVFMTLKLKQDSNIALKDYRRATSEIESLLRVQQSLLQVLNLIAQIIALQNGRPDKDSEDDFGLFNVYLKRARENQNQVQTWHLTNASRLHIDLTSSVLRRSNTLTKTAARIKAPAKIQSFFSTKKLDDSLMQGIVNQLNGDYAAVHDSRNTKPTRILLQNGAAYLQV